MRIAPVAILLLLSAVAQVIGQPTVEPPADASQVPEGINDNFLAADLDPQEWMERFEIESREIYAGRDAIVEQLQLRPGATIVDVGAGTGLFLTPFSDAVGEQGQVYSLDISPRLIEHMRQRVKDEGLGNVKVIMSEPESTTLPNHCADVVFVCDTYHHFEHHAEMLRSIRDTLKPGGQLIVIDFERIPEVSREWVLGHVRAGKDEFKKEIVRSGFTFVKEVKIDRFEENYFLKFQLPK